MLSGTAIHRTRQRKERNGNVTAYGAGITRLIAYFAPRRDLSIELISSCLYIATRRTPIGRLPMSRANSGPGTFVKTFICLTYSIPSCRAILNNSNFYGSPGASSQTCVQSTIACNSSDAVIAASELQPSREYMSPNVQNPMAPICFCCFNPLLMTVHNPGGILKLWAILSCIRIHVIVPSFAFLDNLVRAAW